MEEKPQHNSGDNHIIKYATGIQLPPFWTTQTQKEYYLARLKQNQAKYVCPLKLRLSDKDAFVKLPIDPVISISASNNIVKKTPLVIDVNNTMRGTVKELFSHSDYSINIAGILMGEDDHTFPEEDISWLIGICEANQTVQVACDMLNYFGITRIAIESYDFPFTKGKSNQQFTIKAVSDMFDYNSLIIKK